jgi:hypothetical protein
MVASLRVLPTVRPSAHHSTTEAVFTMRGYEQGFAIHVAACCRQRSHCCAHDSITEATFNIVTIRVHTRYIILLVVLSETNTHLGNSSKTSDTHVLQVVVLTRDESCNTSSSSVQ